VSSQVVDLRSSLQTEIVYPDKDGSRNARTGANRGVIKADGAQLTTDKLAPAILVMQ